jgi:hypothetical protein
MTQSEANQVSSQSINGIQAILHRHSFKSLPIREDGTQIAIRTDDTHDVLYCDILVFKQIKETNKVLREEFSSFIYTLSDLQARHPSSFQFLNPAFHIHTISFLGKKAHVLRNKSGHPVCCQIIPFLVYHSDEFLPSIQERATVHPVQIIHISLINDFLINHIPKQVYSHQSSEKNVQYLRGSYRNLGLTLILSPFLMGLSGILSSLGLSPFAWITFLLGLIGAIGLLRKATNSFKKFQVCHTIPIRTTGQIPPTTPPLKTPAIPITTPLPLETISTTSSSYSPTNLSTLTNSSDIQIRSCTSQATQKPLSEDLHQER